MPPPLDVFMPPYGISSNQLCCGQDMDMSSPCNRDNDVPSYSVSKNIIHERLECGRFIDEAKRHDQKVIVATVNAEGCLMNIFSPHPDLMASKRSNSLRCFGPTTVSFSCSVVVTICIKKASILLHVGTNPSQNGILEFPWVCWDNFLRITTIPRLLGGVGNKVGLVGGRRNRCNLSSWRWARLVGMGEGNRSEEFDFSSNFIPKSPDYLGIGKIVPPCKSSLLTLLVVASAVAFSRLVGTINRPTFIVVPVGATILAIATELSNGFCSGCHTFVHTSDSFSLLLHLSLKPMHANL
uniref:Uncharacterized protein n=1 Tax=Fagus sylvatica TaxID=28930 RepID=A0A2N9F003_FAGSY